MTITGWYYPTTDEVIMTDGKCEIKMDYFDLDAIYWLARNGHVQRTKRMAEDCDDELGKAKREVVERVRKDVHTE